MSKPTYWVCTYCLSRHDKSCPLIFQWDETPTQCIAEDGPACADWKQISREEFLRHEGLLNDPSYIVQMVDNSSQEKERGRIDYSDPDSFDLVDEELNSRPEVQRFQPGDQVIIARLVDKRGFKWSWPDKRALKVVYTYREFSISGSVIYNPGLDTDLHMSDSCLELYEKSPQET